MVNEPIYRQLQDIFEDVFDTEERLTPATVAGDIDGWDSIGHIRLMLAVEERFGIKFSASEITSLKKLADLVELIEEKVRDKASR